MRMVVGIPASGQQPASKRLRLSLLAVYIYTFSLPLYLLTCRRGKDERKREVRDNTKHQANCSLKAKRGKKEEKKKKSFDIMR